MKFEITVLGSGSAVPTKSRNPTAHVINIQEEYLLADCAEGTQLQMRTYGIKMQRIRYIFITHMHGDHIFGLPGLLSTMHLLGRNLPLDIYGPKGLEHAVMTMVDMSRKTLCFELNFHEVPAKEHTLLVENNKFQVYSFPLKHKMPTTGFVFQEKPKKRTYLPEVAAAYNVPVYWIWRIKDGEDFVAEDGTVVPNETLTKAPAPPKSYAFCTDTAYFPDVVPYVKGVNLLYHEASFVEADRARAKATQHSCAADAAKIAAEAGVEKLMLGHFSARYRDLSVLEAEAKQNFNNVVLARDGLVINI